MIQYGIDVSVWQGTIDWHAVAASGKSFAICKRSEGAAIIDPTFAANWAGIREAGMVRGCYHFAQPGVNSPEQEAAHFLAGLPALETGDIIALDIEAGGTQDRSAWALAWLRQVEAAIGYKPLLYSYQDYIHRCLTDPALAAFPLWLASYSTSIPASIGPWPSIALWQYSESERVPGISSNVDGDQLARTLDGLKALGKPTPAPSQPVRMTATRACGGKAMPAHGGANLCQIPQGGQVLMTSQRSTDGAGEVWGLLNYTGIACWAPVSYFVPAGG